MPRRYVWVLALGIALCAAPRAALADGSIVTDGADIASGDGSPRGRTIFDEYAPPSSPPVLGQMPRPAPLVPLVSDLTAPEQPEPTPWGLLVAAGTTKSLAAGVHDFASLTVQQGATLECLGAVTIRVAGNVSIQGSVTSAADGASIRFVCANGFEMATGVTGPSPSITTTGLASPVTIDVAGSISCDAAGGALRSADGGVTLLQHVFQGTLVLRGVDVSTGGGAIDVRSAGSISLSNASISAGGDIDLRAFGGIIDATNAEFEAAGALHVRSRSRISLTDVAATAGAALDVLAVFDHVFLTRATVESGPGSSGDLSVRTGGSIFCSASTLRHRGTGTLLVRPDGDLRLAYPSASAPSSLLHDGTGDVRVTSNSSMFSSGACAVVASHGDVLLQATSVEASGAARFSAEAGSLRFDTSRKVALSPTGSDRARISGGTVRVDVREDLAFLAVDRLDAGFGGLDVTAAGQAFLRGTFASVGPVTIRAIRAGVDLGGADISTAAASGHATAPVVVETFNANTNAILANGARIRSGDATGAPSGDVILSAHTYAGSINACFHCTEFEDGALPDYFEAVAIDAHSVRLSWIPRDPEATGFLVERALGSGTFEPVATAAAGAFYAVDDGLEADTDYRYRISVLTGVLTSAPTDPVRVQSLTNTGVRVLRATVVNKPALRSDTVVLAMKLRLDEQPAGQPFDPSAGPLRVAVGGAFILTVQAGDRRWTQEDGKYAWTGPVGSGGEATVRYDPASGRLDVKAKGFGVVMPGADRSVLTVRAGANAGRKSLRGRAAK